MTIRLLALVSATINVPPAPLPVQRSYVVTAGAVLDVPGDMSGDAAVLVGSGCIPLGTSGATTARPIANLRIGDRHVDTTLDKTVVWDGAAWRDPATGSVV